MGTPLRVAVVTGGHSCDVVAFRRLFRTMEGVDAYVQHLDDFCCQPGHDARTWRDQTFQTILHRGIGWTAGRLN